MAMKEANLFFNYIRKEFPNSRNIVEDYHNADELLNVINKNHADIYILSAIEDQKKNHLKLASEIRARYQNCSILFVINDFEDLKNIINASIIPDYIFANEVTEDEIKKFFCEKNNHNSQRHLLIFTMENRKQIISIQTIIALQSTGKKVSIKVSDRTYITKLTIADLEKILPDYFVRIDKGIIINSEYIKTFAPETETVHLLNGYDFPVSRRGQKRLFEAIDKK